MKKPTFERACKALLYARPCKLSRVNDTRYFNRVFVVNDHIFFFYFPALREVHWNMITNNVRPQIEVVKIEEAVANAKHFGAKVPDNYQEQVYPYAQVGYKDENEVLPIDNNLFN